MKMANEAYENYTQSLIGDTIRKVVYHTHNDDFNTLTHNHRDSFHILDQALLFQMESGISCIFFYGCEFEQHGLDFIIEPCQYMEQSTLDNELLNVSSHKNWAPYIGQQITGIYCHWQDTHHIGAPLLYPKYIQLEFDNQQSIYLCSPHSDNQDEMMIIFDEPTAYRHLAMYMTDQPSPKSLPELLKPIAV